VKLALWLPEIITEGEQAEIANAEAIRAAQAVEAVAVVSAADMDAAIGINYSNSRHPLREGDVGNCFLQCTLGVPGVFYERFITAKKEVGSQEAKECDHFQWCAL